MTYYLKVHEYTTYSEINHYIVEADSIEEACDKYKNEHIDARLDYVESQDFIDVDNKEILEIYDENNNLLERSRNEK